MLRSALEGFGFHESWNELPERVVDAIRNPPGVTAWVSTALTNAVQNAVADTYHPTDADVLAHNRMRTEKVVAMPAYRALKLIAGARTLLRGAVRIHAMFQQGTDLDLDWKGETEVMLILTHPPHLHGGYTHIANEAVFAVVLESAGTQDTVVRMVESSPERALYRLTWTE